MMVRNTFFRLIFIMRQVVLWILLVTSSLFAREVAGKITFLKGQVDVVSLTTGERRIPNLGDNFYTDEQIRTSSKSSAQLILVDTTRVELGAYSIINVKLLGAYEASNPAVTPISFRMLTGKARFLVPTLQGIKKRFEIKTPTMIAASRGGEFAVVAVLPEARLLLYTGEIVVANRSPRFKRAYYLKPRQEIIVPESANPLMPKYIDSSYLSNYFDQYEITKEGQLKKIIREPERFLDVLLKKKKRR